jgi:hypothetical protein
MRKKDSHVSLFRARITLPVSSETEFTDLLIQIKARRISELNSKASDVPLLHPPSDRASPGPLGLALPL